MSILSMKISFSLVTNIPEQGNVINLDPNQWLLPETQDYLKGHDHKADTENDTPIDSKFASNDIFSMIRLFSFNLAEFDDTKKLP